MQVIAVSRCEVETLDSEAFTSRLWSEREVLPNTISPQQFTRLRINAVKIVVPVQSTQDRNVSLNRHLFHMRTKLGYDGLWLRHSGSLRLWCDAIDSHGQGSQVTLNSARRIRLDLTSLKKINHCRSREILQTQRCLDRKTCRDSQCHSPQTARLNRGAGVIDRKHVPETLGRESFGQQDFRMIAVGDRRDDERQFLTKDSGVLLQ